MNTLFILMVIFCGVAFIVYGLLLFVSAEMQAEFKRFKLERFTILTGILELLGGIGLLIGLKFNLILLLSSGGLALLMLLGFGVRLKLKDSFWLTAPSLFFLILNVFIFITTL